MDFRPGRGCLQEKVLALLLWTMVMDNLKKVNYFGCVKGFLKKLEILRKSNMLLVSDGWPKPMRRQLSVLHGFKEGDLTGDLWILGNLSEEALSFNKVTASMAAELHHQRACRVLFQNCGEWSFSGPNFENGFLVWYTNGSKTSKGVGVSVHGTKTMRCPISLVA